jgi:hypothetical protein
VKKGGVQKIVHRGCYYTATAKVQVYALRLWPQLLDFWVGCFPVTWASGGPLKLSARGALPESEVIVEVPFVLCRF